MAQQQARRKFIAIGTSGIIAAFLGVYPKALMASNNSGRKKGIVVHEEEGIHILTGRPQCILKYLKLIMV